MESVRPELAAELNGERVAQRLTHKELAERAGLGRTTVMKILNAQKDPTLPQLEKLAAALSLRVSELALRAERRRRSPSLPYPEQEEELRRLAQQSE